MNQRGSHGGIHPARQAENHLLVTHLLANLLHRFFDMVAHDPVGACAADAQHKALQQGTALHGVRHFRVELHGVIVAAFIGHACDGAGRRGTHHLEAWGQLGDLVAVAHPHLEHAVAFGRGKVFNALEQFGVAMRTHFGVAEFAGVGAFDLAAQLIGHGLHAVANAQHRDTQLKHGGRRLVVHFIHAGVAAREDHALELTVLGIFADPLVGHIARVHFAVDMGLAHTAGDELGDLRAEIKDEDFLVLHGGRQKGA